jgi:hypothetical protein
MSTEAEREEANRQADIDNLLAFDRVLDALGCEALNPDYVAQRARWPVEAIVSGETERFLRTWCAVLRARERMSQRCVRCRAEYSTCAECTEDRNLLDRLASTPIFLCRFFAERARQERRRTQRAKPEDRR